MSPGGPPAVKGTVPPLFTKREAYSLYFLSIGFILFSVVLHFAVGGATETLFPKFKVEATPPPQIVTVQTMLHTPKPTPKPTPTPQPTPTPPPPKNTPAPVHIKLNVVKQVTTDNSTGPAEAAYTPPPAGNQQGVPTAVPTVAPATPAPTVAPPSGPITATDATFAYQAPLDYPQIAKDENIQGTAIVLVTIGVDGTLVSATIAESSGNASLDQAALKAARESRYQPYLVNGKPVEQQYKIVYEFKLDG
jgi:protein TonB